MGYWSKSLYGGDFPCDVEEEYRDYLLDGLSPSEALEAAKSKLLTGDDDEECDLFWMVIADIQWKLGQLERDTLKRALAAIEREAGLNRWATHSEKEQLRHQRAVLKLKAQLGTPQPPLRKLRPGKNKACPWMIGDILAIHLVNPSAGGRCVRDIPLDGKFLSAIVVATKEETTSLSRHSATIEHPILLVYNWMGNECPQAIDATQNKILDLWLGNMMKPGNRFICVTSHIKTPLIVPNKIGHLDTLPSEVSLVDNFYHHPTIWSTAVNIIVNALEYTGTFTRRGDDSLEPVAGVRVDGM